MKKFIMKLKLRETDYSRSKHSEIPKFEPPNVVLKKYEAFKETSYSSSDEEEVTQKITVMPHGPVDNLTSVNKPNSSSSEVKRRINEISQEVENKTCGFRIKEEIFTGKPGMLHVFGNFTSANKFNLGTSTVKEEVKHKNYKVENQIAVIPESSSKVDGKVEQYFQKMVMPELMNVVKNHTSAKSSNSGSFNDNSELYGRPNTSFNDKDVGHKEAVNPEVQNKVTIMAVKYKVHDV